MCVSNEMAFWYKIIGKELLCSAKMRNRRVDSDRTEQLQVNGAGFDSEMQLLIVYALVKNNIVCQK